MRTCEKVDCEQMHHAQGLCKIHYNAAKRTGRIPTIAPKFRGTMRERLDLYSKPSGDCLEWTGGLNPDGYGKVRHNGGQQSVHRVAFEIENGSIPAGQVVDHICHNRACIKPEHLRLATTKTNAENLRGPSARNSTGYLGVSKVPGRDKYRAAVKHHGETHFLGHFSTPEQASEAARGKRNELFTHNDLDRASS